MPKGGKKRGSEKGTRYEYKDAKEPRTLETGHTPLRPADEQIVAPPMDNGWTKAVQVGRPTEGEIKSQIEKRGMVTVDLTMIRPDTLAEGLNATQPEMLFSPLALPDVKVTFTNGNGKPKQAVVTLDGVGVFDRKKRTTDYYPAASGYIAAWYLDEDYDGDCFVDCQMFFDFKKAPNIKAALKAEVDPEEFKLQLTSQPFPVRGYKRIAAKVVDVYGNESTVVKEL